MFDFIDYGAGTGASFDFARSLGGVSGLAIDKAEKAVAACKLLGIETQRIDILDFKDRNVATSGFALDVVQELSGRSAFARALTNMIRGVRDFLVIQHSYFDDDSALALRGYIVERNSSKNIGFKPTVADYVEFLRANAEGLSLSGMALFLRGEVEAKPALPFENLLADRPAAPPVAPKSVRVVLGRKALSRFRPAVAKARTPRQIFLWERT